MTSTTTFYLEKQGKYLYKVKLRTMLKMDTEEEMIIAVLHDLIEDTPYTIKDLRDKGFSDSVLQALDCLTHKGGISYEDYIEKIKKNPLARRVKIADLEDNMDIRRITELNSNDFERLKKYRHYWGKLKEIEKQAGDFEQKVEEKRIKASNKPSQKKEPRPKQLTGFGLEAKEHLKEHRPKMYEGLRKTGKLKAYLIDVQEQAKDQMSKMIEDGASYYEAMEVVRPLLFPPSEEEQPVLGITE